MIIDCEMCNKRFEIDQKLIPASGRLLQCSSCNHKWFFKIDTNDKAIEKKINQSLEIFESKISQENNVMEAINSTNIDEKISAPLDASIKKNDNNIDKIQKKNNFLNLIIVFIISFVALIILIDTFKNPLGIFFPDLEFFLYNLYESIKDIILFTRDLI
jgi:predicted Zn finger-like uncharacterized protein